MLSNLIYVKLVLWCLILCIISTLLYVVITVCQFQSLATQLKAQLDAARSAKSAHDKNKTVTTQEDGEVVVLSRTDRRGMARPLPNRKHAVEPKYGRRKKEKV